MNNSNTDTTDQARDFVRQIFRRTNRIRIDDDGITAEDLTTLFDQGND